MYIKSDPTPYTPFESTTATFVDTPEALAAMLAELKTAKEIAVDLEHHDNRSYIGIVSLMQISTRDKDWIVDTLKPWRRQLECLNEVFADPSILKVNRLSSFLEYIAHITRSSKAPSWTSSGFSETWAFMLSACLTHSTPREPWAIPGQAWRFSSTSLQISKHKSSTS
jgi:hypothetical protein